MKTALKSSIVTLVIAASILFILNIGWSMHSDACRNAGGVGIISLNFGAYCVAEGALIAKSALDLPYTSDH